MKRENIGAHVAVPSLRRVFYQHKDCVQVPSGYRSLTRPLVVWMPWRSSGGVVQILESVTWARAVC